ncbi:MAG: hypothetical protein HUK22_08460, partial [Thermoguttaceae bacterium]|nr:hypothetical protein [Thermoguttaceae bacterium]
MQKLKSRPFAQTVKFWLRGSVVFLAFVAAFLSSAVRASEPVAVVACAGYGAMWDAAEEIADEMKFREIVQYGRTMVGEARGVDIRLAAKERNVVNNHRL